MRQFLALFPVLAFLLQPVVGPLPTKEELCSTVVDIEVRKLCLDCFTDAGSLQESPDEFRFCVGSYLPQSLADCSVPHHEKRAMQHAQPNVHHNHTNANLMPRCLTKSLERLQRYLERENIIARSGGRIVKAVATSNLVKDGGPVLMGVVAQNKLLEQRDVKSMVDSVASECLTKYHNHGHGSGGGTRSRRMSVRTLEKALTLDLEEAAEEDAAEDFSSIIQEDDGWRGRRFAGNRGNGNGGNGNGGHEGNGNGGNGNGGHGGNGNGGHEGNGNGGNGNGGNGNGGNGNGAERGNNLPFDGKGPLAESILKGQCIVNKLIENHFGYELISLMSREEFFLPIPSWWLEPLAVYYKEFREKFENGTSV